MTQKEMHPPHLPMQLQATIFCPSCGHALNRGKCADPWSICLSCDNDHRFFVMPEDPRTYSINVIAADAIGNVGSCAAVVTVPHDQGR